MVSNSRIIAFVAFMGCGETTAPNDTSPEAVEPGSSTGQPDDQEPSGSTTVGEAPGQPGGSSTGAVFIVEIDGGTGVHECDVFAQDCPLGDKCMPWANDGGNSWNAMRCSEVADSPGVVGDECSVEGSGVSGIDDCDIATMCWNVDPETNLGTCVAMCTGDRSSPVCDDPGTICSISNEGVLALCLPVCDPLLQDCAEGQACYPIQDAWSCAPDASGEAGVYADPCEFINVCDPGLVCLGAAAVPGCASSVGCCTEVCNITDPAGDMQCSGAASGQTCQPWYEEGAAPPGYEDVGACALPG